MYNVTTLVKNHVPTIFVKTVGIVFVLFLAGCGLKEPDLEANTPLMRRLTEAQYVNSIKDIFGDDIHVPVAFEPLVRNKHDLLASSTSESALSSLGYERNYAAAHVIAFQVIDERHRETLIPCRPVSIEKPDDQCASLFFKEVGRYLFRRPLTDSEAQVQVQAARRATIEVNDFYNGLAVSLATMLSSPDFLFRFEGTELDPLGKGEYRLTAYAKASRISYFFWNTTPDKVLLDAAEQGDLHDPQKLSKHIDRLASSPRVKEGVREFFKDMLEFERFETLRKDSVIYPFYNPLLAQDMKEQILRTLTGHLIDTEASYQDIFTTKETFLTRRLGVFYQIPVISEDGWEPYTLARDGARAGLVALPGFLAMHSHPGRSSPTLRGIAIREFLMCQKIPDPPAAVDFTEIEAMPDDATARERLSVHNSDMACASCHEVMDPIGLPLEKFDGAGAFRGEDIVKELDVSGSLDGKRFSGAQGLGLALSKNPEVTSCLIKRLYEYALGQSYPNLEKYPEAESWLNFMDQRFKKNNYQLIALMRELALSKTFLSSNRD